MGADRLEYRAAARAAELLLGAVYDEALRNAEPAMGAKNIDGAK